MPGSMSSPALFVPGAKAPTGHRLICYNPSKSLAVPFCTALGAKVSLSSGYHPQSNGQTERLNQELKAALRCVTARNPSSWSLHLPWVEYAHNALTSSATGLSPFEASLGYQPPLFPEEERDLAVTSVQHHL